MTKTTTDVQIRWMTRRDLPAVLTIEQACFAEFPWSEDSFIECLLQRNCIGMVAEIDETIVGFMVYELHRTKLHLLDFAVDPCFQKSGIGKKMIEKIVAKLYGDRSRILLEVRESNLDALMFFKAMGFVATSILRGFYDECDDDAIVMMFRKQDPQSKEAHGVSSQTQTG